MLLMVNKPFQKVCGKLVFVSFLWIYWKDFGKCTLVWKMCGIICAKFQKTLKKKKKIEKVKIERLICTNATHSIFGGNIWNIRLFLKTRRTFVGILSNIMPSNWIYLSVELTYAIHSINKKCNSMWAFLKTSFSSQINYCDLAVTE